MVILLASGNRLRTTLQETRHAYRECYSNEVLKCEVFIEGIAEGKGLVIRCGTNECINAPTIQISDESAALLASQDRRGRCLRTLIVVQHLVPRADFHPASRADFHPVLRADFHPVPRADFHPEWDLPNFPRLPRSCH